MAAPGDRDAIRRHRRLATEIKASLRDLRNQLSLLNHRVVTRLELKDIDLDCLELIARDGPLGPTELARRAGLHPATMTGILDRLQRGGWIIRERDPEATDRRAVTVRAMRDRMGELFRLYSGMSTAMDEICDRYTDAELETIADFLTRATRAGEDATTELS
ncbi:MarR family transcriptional regulator [Pseudonocardia sp. DSM 110487]|uniref:MarR family transcriptional regulator n=1 Tax=Pseudonocardia sp. DSM 110487 TaxID=2865833 RepID=UPI001C6988C5|nr:MarR family transcriptional regulator [Pseudonocardia sp. DSM 110487]QYN37699.1 MarR family transcriptional regulator [Pseudonocardia sp. DSM 110487]